MALLNYSWRVRGFKTPPFLKLPEPAPRGVAANETSDRGNLARTEGWIVPAYGHGVGMRGRIDGVPSLTVFPEMRQVGVTFDG